MASDCAITHRLLSRQRTMFRLAASQHGFSQKVIHLETGMGVTTIGQYARGETAMSGPAIIKLSSIKDFPAALLSDLLFDDLPRCVVNVGGDDGDHDTAAEHCDNVASLVRRARSPNSPAGVEIADCEDREIRVARAALQAKAA